MKGIQIDFGIQRWRAYVCGRCYRIAAQLLRNIRAFQEFSLIDESEMGNPSDFVFVLPVIGKTRRNEDRAKSEPV